MRSVYLKTSMIRSLCY